MRLYDRSTKIVALAALAVFLGAAGSATGVWQLFYMAAVVAALPALSMALAYLSAGSVRVERLTPPAPYAGEPFYVSYLVESAGPALAFALQIEDEKPPIRALAKPWIGLNPGKTTLVRCQYVSPIRGVFPLERLRVVGRDLLLLSRIRKAQRAPGELVVYPKPQPIALRSLAGRDREALDMVRASVVGSGVDLHGVREYVAGDPLRRMHWKTVARTGRLHVMEFEEARRHDVHIVLDTYRGASVSGDPNGSFEHMVTAAASVANEALAEDATVALTCTGHTDLSCPSGRGSDHLVAIFEALARVGNNNGQRLHEQLAAMVANLDPATTVVVITADEGPALTAMLGRCVAMGFRFEVIWADRSTFPEKRLIRS